MAEFDEATIDALVQEYRALATPEEVDFLTARVLGDAGIDPATVPYHRHALGYLAGMAAKLRGEREAGGGMPFSRLWESVWATNRIGFVTDPQTLEFWGRVEDGMETIATPYWRADR